MSDIRDEYGFTFSRKLREVRQFRDISQSKLAELAGFVPSQISHFELNSRSPNLENICKLADALDVSVDYLLGRSKEFYNPSKANERFQRLYLKLPDQDRELLNTIARELEKRVKRDV